MAVSRRRRFFGAAFLALVALLGVIMVRARAMPSRQLQVTTLQDEPIDTARVSKHMSELVAHKTVSSEDDGSLPAVAALHKTLEASFPRVHASLTREVIAGSSLLYTWKGTDAALEPILLLAHMDVVPVEPGTEKGWTHPAYDGKIADGFVWGRGAIDDKLSLLTIFEATEWLLEHDFAPKRTIYLAFGHDEEVAGKHGAVAIVEALAARKVHAEFALDEGGAITDGIVKEVSSPLAVIGLGEKGYMTLNLSVDAPGGHSSTPAKTTSIGILAAALTKIEANPLDARIDGAMKEFATFVAPEMAFGPRLAFANLWLTEPLVVRALASAPTTNASIRTTTAVTIFHAGIKDNVIPQSAKATVNFRILPGDTSESVLAHVRRVVGDDRVKAEIERASVAEPSPLSRSDARGFEAIARTVREVFPGTLVTPNLTLGATDGRHYVRVAKDVYRFLPVKLTPSDVTRIHGTDERVAVSAIADAVRFYRRLIQTTCN